MAGLPFSLRSRAEPGYPPAGPTYLTRRTVKRRSSRRPTSREVAAARAAYEAGKLQGRVELAMLGRAARGPPL